MQIDFEKRVLELGLSYRVHHDDFYTISNPMGGGNHVKVRLISTIPLIKREHESKNGNEVQAIGMFKFMLPASGLIPDILGFAFYNAVKNQVEFLIIPTDELMSRLVRKNPGYVHGKRVQMVIWLMSDGWVYDTKDISPEGEWYFMSKGRNGRMADGTKVDYTKFRNCWRRLVGKVNRP